MPRIEDLVARIRIDGSPESRQKIDQIGREFDRLDSRATQSLGRIGLNMNRLNSGPLATTTRGFATLATGLSPLSGGFSILAGSMGGASLAAVSLAAGITAVGASAVSNGQKVRTMLGQITALTGSAERASGAFDLIYDSTLRTGAVLQDTAGQFNRLTIASERLGRTDADVARVVETLSKLGAVGGASTQELSAGIYQLSQGLASGRLQGDELRSILENLPLVAKAIAEEFGVSVGQLRELGSTGQLTADRIFDALLKKGAEADRMFAELPDTTERAGNRLATAWTRFTAQLDESIGLSRTLASILNDVAGAIDSVRSGLAPTTSDVLQTLQNRRAAILGSNAEHIQFMEGAGYTRAQMVAELPALAEVDSLDKRIADTKRLLDIERRRQDAADVAASKTAQAKKDEADRVALAQKLKDLTEALQTPQEKARAEFDQRVKQLDEMLRAGPERGGIDQATYTTLRAKAERELADALAKRGGEEKKAATEAARNLAVLADLNREIAYYTLPEGQRDRARFVDQYGGKISDGLPGQEADARKLAGILYDQREAEKATNEERKKAVALLDRLAPETETYAQKVAALRNAQRLYGLDPKRVEQAIAALDPAKTALDDLGAYGERAFDRIGEAITQSLATGEMGMAKFADVARATVSEILQLFMQLAIINPLKNVASGAQPGQSGWLPTISNLAGSIAGSLFGTSSPGVGGSFGAGDTTGSGGAGFSYTGYGGPRASGGPVQPGRLYQVGERGREWFVPDVAGRIVPAGGGPAGASVVNNVSVINQSGAEVQKSERANASGGVDLEVVIGGAAARQMTRPGSPAQRAMASTYGLKAQTGRR